MNRPVLRSSRIELSPMTAEHLPLLAELDADAEVLRFILGRARTVAEAFSFWAPICEDVDADAVGLGWWVGWHRDTGDFLGWWDLSPARPVRARPSRAEAGWRLARRHWRQGYATEGATTLFDHGFRALRLQVVWAETMAVNLASRAVMARLGMHHVRTDHRAWDEPLPGSEQGEVSYEVTRDDWLLTRAQNGGGSGSA